MCGDDSDDDDVDRDDIMIMYDWVNFAGFAKEQAKK